MEYSEVRHNLKYFAQCYLSVLPRGCYIFWKECFDEVLQTNLYAGQSKQWFQAVFFGVMTWPDISGNTRKGSEIAEKEQRANSSLSSASFTECLSWIVGRQTPGILQDFAHKKVLALFLQKLL